MTATRRIIINVLATYGRSLLSMACGIFSARWILMALGETDYGIYGVVGALAALVTFINTALSSSVSRFYAFYIGRAQVADDYEVALEDCRKWFSVAVLIHLVVPVLLMAIGYPLGVWAIEHYLTIPQDRIQDGIWVYRWVCIGCFGSMVNVPYMAMYLAKQYIAELTLYSIASTLIIFLFSWWMAYHPQTWLVPYAFVMTLSSIIPQVVIMVRGHVIHSECRFSGRYAFDWGRIAELGKFAAWNTLTFIGWTIRNQGTAIVVNKFFGPKVNAAMTIANSVNGHASNLSTALTGAFLPAITNAYGAKQYDLMRALTYRASKFGLILALVFVLPLCLEISTVLELWLKTPPTYASEFCIFVMIGLLFDKASIGHCVAVQATGIIARYQIYFGIALSLVVPLSIIFFKLFGGIYTIGVSIIVSMFLAAVSRVFEAKRVAEVPIQYWFFRIVLPILLASLITIGFSYAFHLFFNPYISRILLTTVLSEIVFLPLCWYFVLDKEEQLFVKQKIIGRVLKRLRDRS